MLVDKHDYHTFQPLLYQLATDLLETSAVGHPLRDLFHEQPNVAVHQDAVTGIDLAKREVSFAEMAPIAYDYLVLGLGAEVNFFGTKGAAEHAFPMYTLADAVRLKEHVLRRWEAADKDASLVEDGALNVVVVGGGPTGIETAGALAELYRGSFVKDYPALPHEKARIILVEAGPELLTMFKKDIRTYTKKALERVRRRGDARRAGRLGRADPRQPQVRHGARRSHARLGRGAPGEPDRVLPRPPAREGQSRPRPPGSERRGPSRGVRRRRRRLDHRHEAIRSFPQLGSVALQAGERAGENVARLVGGKEAEPFSYHDKGTMATIGRGAAVVQFRRGRTMKGKAAALAWGTVHLALLSTGEDRAKAMTDWAWAGFAHERPGRITVRTDE